MKKNSNWFNEMRKKEEEEEEEEIDFQQRNK